MKLTQAFVFTVLAAGGLMAGGSAFAQNSSTTPVPPAATNMPPIAPRPMPHGTSVDRLGEILNLNETQKSQVRAILLTEGKKMRALHQDASLTVDERRAKMKEIGEDINTQMKPILTPEQWAKWQNITHSNRPVPRLAPRTSTNPPVGSPP